MTTQLTVPYLAMVSVAMFAMAAVAALLNGVLTARRRYRNGDDLTKAAFLALTGAGSAGVLLVFGGILAAAAATTRSAEGLPYGGYAGTIISGMQLAGVIVLVALVPATAVVVGTANRRRETPDTEGAHHA